MTTLASSVKPAFDLARLLQEVAKDQRFAAQRILTNWCPEKETDPLKRKLCDHTRCWDGRGITDPKEQLAFCERYGLRINAVLGLNGNLNVRAA